jgi:hypothetical protein
LEPKLRGTLPEGIAILDIIRNLAEETIFEKFSKEALYSHITLQFLPRNMYCPHGMGSQPWREQKSIRNYPKKLTKSIFPHPAMAG